MNLKPILAAAVVATMPMVAGAATLIDDGDIVSIGTGGDDTEFFGSITGDGGAGTWTVTFNSTDDPLKAGASATIGNIVFSQFSDLMIEWISNADNAILNSAAITPIVTELGTTFQGGLDLSQNLVISWSNSTDGAEFDIEIAAPIPLPAGILLMGTALAGFGVARRRKKAA